MAMSLKTQIELYGIENQLKFPMELQEQTKAILENADNKDYTASLGKNKAIKLKIQCIVFELFQIQYGYIKLNDAKINQWNIYVTSQDGDGIVSIDSRPEKYDSIEEIISYGWVVDQETPFVSEEEFKNIVLQTPEILGELFILKLPSNNAAKGKLPAFIGIDNDEVLYVVEIKNVVDSKTISSMLKYKDWINENLDVINSLLNESKDKPAHISWNGYRIEMIIVSPSILIPYFIKKIGNNFSLIEVKRWVGKNEQLLSINKPEPSHEGREFILLNQPYTK